MILVIVFLIFHLTFFNKIILILLLLCSLLKCLSVGLNCQGNGYQRSIIPVVFSQVGQASTENQNSRNFVKIFDKIHCYNQQVAFPKNAQIDRSSRFSALCLRKSYWYDNSGPGLAPLKVIAIQSMNLLLFLSLWLSNILVHQDIT